MGCEQGNIRLMLVVQSELLVILQKRFNALHVTLNPKPNLILSLYHRCTRSHFEGLHAPEAAYLFNIFWAALESI